MDFDFIEIYLPFAIDIYILLYNCEFFNTKCDFNKGII